MSDSKGGDPGITDAFENSIKHILEANELDDFGVRWFIKNEQDGSNGMGDCDDGQFEYLWVRGILAHEANKGRGVFSDLCVSVSATVVSDSRQGDQGHITGVLSLEEGEEFLQKA